MKHCVTASVALALAGATLSCHRAKDREQPPASSPANLDELKWRYEERYEKARQERDPETGWVDRWGCDAFIWAGKYAASKDVTGVKLEAAEYGVRSGKFGRRPPPWCWTPDGGDQGAKTEWSRDMAVAGLFPWAYFTADRAALERHRDYGKLHHWQMGAPLEERVLYTPQVQDLLSKLIQALGGSGGDTGWPDYYPAGTTDYEAHLQVMSIYLQGEAARALADPSGAPRRGSLDDESEGDLTLRVSEAMFDRLMEHAGQEPSNALYRAVLGLYDGNLGPAVDLLVSSDWAPPGYCRCSEPAQCADAEWLFAASVVLRKLVD